MMYGTVKMYKYSHQSRGVVISLAPTLKKILSPGIKNKKAQISVQIKAGFFFKILNRDFREMDHRNMFEI